MRNRQVIYFDVGCWQSMEEEEPIMTFGLIEHNTIVLCNYYSNGKTINRKPFINKDIEYDFNRTLSCLFLNELLKKKYKGPIDKFLVSSASPNAKDYHIIKLMAFPSRTLLENENRLLIFIPDTHLHYFKLSYLDNFITWYSNSWSVQKRRPIGRKLENRISMEQDFSVFLETIAEFQGNSTATTSIVHLGDMTEMWETQTVIENFITYDERANEMVKHLHDLLGHLRKDKFDKEIITILDELYRINLHKLPYDPVLMEQVDTLKNDLNELGKIQILDEDSGDTIKQKSEYLLRAILKKYKNQDQKNYVDLFESIKWKRHYTGNHENYLALQSLEPLWNFEFISKKKFDNWLRKKYRTLLLDSMDDTGRNTETAFWIEHGHSFDQYNNNCSCGLGYFIVTLLNFIEGKKKGDILKKAEGSIIGDPHENYIKTFTPILHEYEMKYGVTKNIVIVHAHTHKPYLENITRKYEETIR